MTSIFCKILVTHRPTRFAAAALALLLGALGGCADLKEATLQCSRSELAYVGTDGGSLQALRLDACAGSLQALGPVAPLQKARWSVADPARAMLYVANDNGAKDGQVYAFAVQRETGALTEVNEVSAGGAGTTHLWLDAPSRTLLAANFGAGSATSIALRPDGSLDALVSTVRSIGSGPTRRQTGPHAHGVVVDPSGRYALVPDLGADRIFVDDFDRQTHVLTGEGASHARAFAAPPGSGPHHVVFGADGRFVYLLNELSADLTVLRWDANLGTLTAVQSLPISSADFQGAKSGAELDVSRDGRFVYVADRGESRLVVYRVDPTSGRLLEIQRIASGGERPWTFAIHPSGRWMLVANSKKLSLFSIDPVSGQLADSGQSLDLIGPLSIAFMH